jgi:putative ABC transport system permease protein
MTTWMFGPSAFREIVADAMGNLQALKGRTMLALVGIAIGTAAVIAMLHIGNNARAEAMRQFESLGIDRVSIRPQPNGTANTMIPVDFAKALVSSNVGLAVAAPVIQAGTVIRIGRTNVPATLIAAGEGVYPLGKAHVGTGRPTSDLDAFAAYVVLGSDVAHGIGEAAGHSPQVGDQLTVDDQVMTVIGLLAPTLPNPVLNLDFNHSVIIPLAAARRLLPDPQISSIVAQLAPGSSDEKVADAVTQAFRSRIRDGGINVQTARQLIAGLDQQMRVYGMLLLAIGTVSLVVGGVGVMNVMLMSVMERRREIGVRLAIGARQCDIAAMFMAEALLLSAIGSTIGIVLGTFVGWGFAAVSGWAFEPAASALPLGVGMAITVGLFFGLYPAMRAAKLDPIHALRAE